MKFIVRRTSLFDDDVAPCEEARKEPYLRLDKRHAERPEDIPAARGESDWWWKDGLNHRAGQDNGEHWIARDFEDQEWLIELEPRKIMEFVKKYRRVVISATSWFSEEYPQIEIYDDWRE